MEFWMVTQCALLSKNVQHCINKGRKEEDCKQVNIDANNAGFKICHKCFSRIDWNLTVNILFVVKLHRVLLHN